MESRIDKLLPDLSKMSDEELQEFHQQIRVDRRVNKKVAVSKQKKARKAKDQLQDILAKMSPQQVKELLGDK